MNTQISPAARYLTLVEVLELTRPFHEVAQALEAAVARLEREGLSELVSVQFYAGAEATQIGAVITFADHSRVMEHMRLISGWEEFHRFAGMIRLVDLRVYGTLSPEAEAWIGTFGAPNKRFGRHVAGFVRVATGSESG